MRSLPAVKRSSTVHIVSRPLRGAGDYIVETCFGESRDTASMEALPKQWLLLTGLLGKVIVGLIGVAQVRLFLAKPREQAVCLSVID